MPWTLTDVRGSLPNKLTKNSVNNDISKRNAYEHVTALYNELHALRDEMRKAGEVPQVIDNLFKNVRNLKYVLDGTKLPDDRKENAKTSLEDGSFKNNLEQFYLELEKEAGIVTKDAKKKIQLKQLVQYLNYALHLESEKIPENEEYKLNYRSVENKIGQDKEQEAENAEQIDRYNADVDRYFGYGNSARTAIERMQRELLSPEFENKTEDERISLIAAILSARAAAGSVMGKASTLREMDKEEFAENYIGLMKSASFRSFIADQGVRGLQRLMTGRTHGGNLEKAFTDFYVRRLDLYDPIPSRFAPKTSAVIEALKQDVLDYDKGGEFLARTMAHIFAARIVTGAKRGESSSVNKKLNLPTFRDQSLKIFGSQTFKKFVADNENALTALCKKRGHGGAMHEMMQKSIAKMKTLPLDVPTEYMPTTKQRITELQKIIKSNAFKTMDFEEKKELFTEYYAVRMEAKGEINIHNGNDNIDRPINPANYKKSLDELKNSEGFSHFLAHHINQKTFKDAALNDYGVGLEIGLRQYADKFAEMPDLPGRYVSKGKYIVEAEPEYKATVDGLMNKDRSALLEVYDDDGGWDKQFISENKEGIQKMAARSMYLQSVKLNRNIVPNLNDIGEPLDENVIEQHTNDILASPAFKRMVKNVGSTEKLAEMVIKADTNLISKFADANQELQKENDNLNKEIEIQPKAAEKEVIKAEEGPVMMPANNNNQ